MMAAVGAKRWAMLAGVAFLMLASDLARPVAAETAATPTPRSPERKAILDALREPVERELGAPVDFKVNLIRVAGNWALMTGVPQRPGGRAIDYRRTRYAQAMREGVFDDNVQALLRREGRGWRVVTHVIGATDVSWAAWPEKYPAAPRSLFPNVR